MIGLRQLQIRKQTVVLDISLSSSLESTDKLDIGGYHPTSARSRFTFFNIYAVIYAYLNVGGMLPCSSVQLNGIEMVQ